MPEPTTELHVGCKMDIVVPVRVAYTGVAVEDATVVAQVKDSDGVNVGAQITCSHQDDGEYLGQIPAATALVEGDDYTVEITVSGTADDSREILCTAERRRIR